MTHAIAMGFGPDNLTLLIESLQRELKMTPKYGKRTHHKNREEYHQAYRDLVEKKQAWVQALLKAAANLENTLVACPESWITYADE